MNVTVKQVSVPHHGRVMDADYYLPEGSGPRAAVVLCHGFGGDKMLFAWLAEYFAQQGLAALCVSLCGGGLGDLSGFPSTSMTIFTQVEDALAAHAWVKEQPDVIREQVYLFGESHGGMASALAAVREPDAMRALMLLYPALCVPDDWRMRFPRVEDMPEGFVFWDLPLGREYLKAVHDMDIFQEIRGYHGPTLIMHGADDPIVNVSYSERAVSCYEQGELHIVPGEGHGFTAEGREVVKRLCMAFINSH